MHFTKEEIRTMVQKNIHQIKISEFASEGGWPNIDDVDVEVFKTEITSEKCEVYIHILYTVERAGCCFIPGKQDQMRLPKKLSIQNKIVKFKCYE